ncbi:hypothetical protein CAJAP_02251 [Camponotus japonicus]
MAGCRDGRLAGSCIRASVAAQQVQARSLDHSLISSCIPTVRRAACLVPIGRIISNCHDATTTSIPYSLAGSTIKRYEHCDNGHSCEIISLYSRSPVNIEQATVMNHLFHRLVRMRINCTRRQQKVTLRSRRECISHLALGKQHEEGSQDKSAKSPPRQV